MRLFSGISGLILLLIALAFALSNRQPADISLWPFDIAFTAPLYLLIIASVALGLALGACVTFASMLPHRMAARRLRQDIASVHAKLDTLQGLIAQTGDAAAGQEPETVSRWRWKGTGR